MTSPNLYLLLSNFQLRFCLMFFGFLKRKNLSSNQRQSICLKLNSQWSTQNTARKSTKPFHSNTEVGGGMVGRKDPQMASGNKRLKGGEHCFSLLENEGQFYFCHWEFRGQWLVKNVWSGKREGTNKISA